jgi:hypothetical protein
MLHLPAAGSSPTTASQSQSKSEATSTMMSDESEMLIRKKNGVFDLSFDLCVFFIYRNSSAGFILIR